MCTNIRIKQVCKSGVDTMLHLKAHLSLRENSKPRLCKPHPVPFAIKDCMGKELDRRDSIRKQGFYTE